jgi:Abortive infection alpha
MKKESRSKAKFEISSQKISASLPAEQVSAVGEQIRELTSPLVESAGLVGDYIRFFRQRAAVRALAKVKQLAFERNVKLKPIPPKMLIPWVEAVSLEEEDSSLINLWSNLLVSAVEKFNAHQIHFVSIISRMSQLQALLLREIVRTPDAHRLGLAMDNVDMYFRSEHARRGLEQFPLRKMNKKRVSYRTLQKALIEYFKLPGVAPVYCAIGKTGVDGYLDLDFSEPYQDAREVDFSILEALGLLRRVETDEIHKNGWFVSAIYYHLTSLGYHFAIECRLVASP